VKGALFAAALLALGAAVADAALPAPPFDLTLSSTSLIEGEPVTIRVTPTARPSPTARYDVYLLLASVEEAAFLTPEGTWAPTPVPYARSVSTADPPIVRPWPHAWPPGHFAFGLVVVPPSSDPLVRDDWRYRPAITWFDVAPRGSGAATPASTSLVVLGVAAATAAALVWWATLGRATAGEP
jgi:hypothetical protein